MKLTKNSLFETIFSLSKMWKDDTRRVGMSAHGPSRSGLGHLCSQTCPGGPAVSIRRIHQFQQQQLWSNVYFIFRYRIQLRRPTRHCRPFTRRPQNPIESHSRCSRCFTSSCCQEEQSGRLSSLYCPLVSGQESPCCNSTTCRRPSCLGAMPDAMRSRTHCIVSSSKK